MKITVLVLLLFACNTLMASIISFDSLLQEGALLCEQGQVKKGISLVEQAKDGFEKNEDWSMYTQASISYWYAYYQLNGDIDTVLFSFENLGQLVNQKIPDSLDIAANVNLYQSYFLYYDNQIGESMKASETALKFYEKNRTRNLENISSLYNNLGVLYSEQGNNKKAEDYMLKSIEIKTDFDEQGIPFSEETIVFNFLNLANMYYFAGRYDLFLNYQLKLKEKLDQITIDPNIRLRLVKNYLRYYLRNKKDLELAKVYLDELLNLEKTFDVDFYNNLGDRQLEAEYYETQNDLLTAERLQIQMVQDAEKFMPNRELGLVEFYTNLSEFYVRQEQYDKALNWNDTCLSVLGSLKTENLRLLTNKQIQYLAVGYGTRIAIKFFDKKGDAFNHQDEILMYGDLYMNTLREFASRLDEIHSLTAYLDFDLVLSALISTHQSKGSSVFDAMELIELKQALPLLKNKRDIAQISNAQVSQSILSDYRSSNAKLNQLRAKYDPKKNNEANDILASKILNASITKDSINEAIKDEIISNGGNILGPLDTEVNQDDFTNSVGSDECLVQYFQRNNELYIILKNSDEEKLIAFDSISNIKESIVSLRQYITSPQSWDRDSFYKNSSQLYNQLISPIERYIDKKTMVIVPTGIFNYLPFEVLIKSVPEKNDKPKYLVQSNELRYLYSLKDKATSSKSNTEGRIAFAPNFENESNKGFAVRSGYDALAGAERETQMLSSDFSFVLYHGNQATKNEFIKASKNANLIHLASHASIDENSPLQSYIVFDNADSLSNEQQRLYAYELYEMSIDADLAVLSACNTGMGTLHKFNGVISLARAFQFAGVRSTVMSLWPAQDESTSELMQLFYENLSNGETKSRALQHAKMTYLESADELHSQPFYWASFVVQGSNHPISSKTRNWPIVLAGLVLAGILTYLIKRRSSSALAA